MAQSKSAATNRTNEPESNDLKYMIIWLDKHIGKSEQCIFLKSSFFMTMDPTTGLFERELNKDDIDRSICLQAPFLVRLDEVEFVFQAFDDIVKCYETIEKNLQKRIFFITSGSLGKIIVPSLVKLYPETFPSDNPIFIFCANLIMKRVGDAAPSNLWLEEFLENVLPCDHQDILLARMTREIADYLAKEAKQFTDNDQIDTARQYQDWSERIRSRHRELIKIINSSTYDPSEKH